VDAAGIRVVTGYDPADLSAGEVPELMVDTLRASVAGTAVGAADTLAEDVEAVRSAIPEEHRRQFDELLEEARATCRIRDERGYLNDAWACGIARRAILAAGERLVNAGRLESGWHAFDFTPPELISALRGGPAPSANAAARMSRIVTTVLGEMFAKRDVTAATSSVEGFPASPGEAVATARIILDPGDISRVRQGDILVARATGPSLNALLPLIRGIVTDRGGTLSHAALVAREYGIPAVVGCGNATVSIPDGARIRINGTTGVVEILS